MVLTEAVLKTITYADIFKFPLTLDEIWLYLISDTPVQKKDVEKAVNLLLKKGIVFEHFGFIGFDKKTENAKKRAGNIEIVREKVEKAKAAATLLKKIPSVMFVGISGGVAVGNAVGEDDIDLFIITRKDTIWVTRFLCVFSMSQKNLRRKRNDKNVKDKVCLNMFLSESSLSIPTKKQNIYTAHEVAQLVPVFDRSGTFDKFIKTNSWIRKFLPNFKQKKPFIKAGDLETSTFDLFYKFPFRKAVKILQKIYMFPHRTREEITDEVLAFHPKDYKGLVLKAYGKKVLQYNPKANEKI